jgi:hypothetical protein
MIRCLYYPLYSAWLNLKTYTSQSRVCATFNRCLACRLVVAICRAARSVITHYLSSRICYHDNCIQLPAYRRVRAVPFSTIPLPSSSIASCIVATSIICITAASGQWCTICNICMQNCWLRCSRILAGATHHGIEGPGRSLHRFKYYQADIQHRAFCERTRQRSIQEQGNHSGGRSCWSLHA